MDELNLKTLQNENGFIYRKQTIKTKRIRNILPFSLVSQNKLLSDSLYGVPALTRLSLDIPFEQLKNTKYVSFDYEKYLNQEVVEPKDSFSSKRSHVSRRAENGLSRKSRLLKRSLRPCYVKLEKLEKLDLSKFKISNESHIKLEKIAKVQNISLKITKQMSNKEEEDDVIFISEEEGDKYPIKSNTPVKVKNSDTTKSNITSIPTSVSDKDRSLQSQKINNSCRPNTICEKNTYNHVNTSIQTKRSNSTSSSHNKVTSYKTIYRSYQNGKVLSTEYIKYSKYSPMSNNGRSILKEKPIKAVKLTISKNSEDKETPTPITYSEFISLNKRLQLEKNKYKSLINENSSASLQQDIELIDLTI